MNPIRTTALFLAMSALPAQRSPDLGPFALRLLDAASPSGNACLSPWSLATVLAMARAGAAGDCAREIDAALGLDDDGWRALAKALAAPATVEIAVAGKAQDVPAYELLLANAAWARPEEAFTPRYLELLADTFAAPIRRADFTSDAGRDAVNAWVAQQTRDRIPELFGPGTPPRNSRLVLVNCVYLKAAWADPFVAAATAAAPFHLEGGSTAEVPTMQRTQDEAYFASERAHFVDLPFRGSDLAMLLVVPKALEGEAAARADLAERWPLRGKTARRRVQLHLPRFECNLSYSLVPALQRLGIEQAFDKDRADFSGMTGGRDLYVTTVVQRTFVKVDEEGTEAAAATGAALAPTSAAPSPPEEPVVVRADRPFLFVIHQRRSGAILFTGRISDPRARGL